MARDHPVVRTSGQQIHESHEQCRYIQRQLRHGKRIDGTVLVPYPRPYGKIPPQLQIFTKIHGE
jgi:hypothetical protein